MTRHVIDNRSPTHDSGRIRHFAAVQKDDATPHPASMSLLRREGVETTDTALKHFLRIERGREA